jgi:ribosomal protein S18 acetylase RimI-like enzyme
MMSTPRSQFTVRELRSEDELAECLTIDRSYLSDRVWQMDVREDRGEIAVRFRPVRLPRMVAVEYPRPAESLLHLWRQRDCFLVALAEGIILGYVNVRIRPGEQGAWLEDLVVNAPFRRHKIGSALLEQAGEHAHDRGLRRLTLAVQTKNHPAISFAQANGLVFCGYNDHYFPNQDIAIFFTKNLR